MWHVCLWTGRSNVSAFNYTRSAKHYTGVIYIYNITPPPWRQHLVPFVAKILTKMIIRFDKSLSLFACMSVIKNSPPPCHHISFVDFVVRPPGHGKSVTDFWGWDAHEAQLRCPDVVWVVIEGDVVPGGALNLKSTNLRRPWSPWESSPSRKIPTVEPGIEPGTSWLVVRDSDH